MQMLCLFKRIFCLNVYIKTGLMHLCQIKRQHAILFTSFNIDLNSKMNMA
jgi:hypothetical protein